MLLKFSADPLIFQGEDRAAPGICCGNCGAVLIRDMLFSSFVSLGEDDSVSPSRAIFIPIGRYGLSQSVTVPPETTIVSDNGPLVLHCTACRVHNELVSSESIN